MAKKVKEVNDFNQEHKINKNNVVNGRRLTNIGTFRAYAQAYIDHHPQIKSNMTKMVRQLTPTPQGLPIEIYAFTATIEWLPYEAIQANIFDHLLAVINEFNLQIFQNPTGKDFKALKAN